MHHKLLISMFYVITYIISPTSINNFTSGAMHLGRDSGPERIDRAICKRSSCDIDFKPFPNTRTLWGRNNSIKKHPRL